MGTEESDASIGWLRKYTGSAALVLLLILPALPAYALIGGDGATAALFGALVGFISGLASGLRRTLQFVPALVMAGAASMFLAGTWWWVLGLAVLGALAGWSYRWGLFTPLVMVGLLFALTQPLTAADAASGAVVLLILSLFNGLGVARIAGARWNMDPVVLDPYPAAWTAAALGLAAGVAGALTIVWDRAYGYWLPMTVFIVALPRPGVGLGSRSVARVSGTLLGVLLGSVVAWVGPPVAVIVAVGYVAVMISLSTDNLLLGAASAAAALVMFLSTFEVAGEVAETRLAATFAAVAILAGTAALTHWLAGRHSPFRVGEDLAERVQILAGEEPEVGQR